MKLIRRNTLPAICLALAAVTANQVSAVGNDTPGRLVLSGTSVNLDRSSRALADGLDGTAIRHAQRVLERNPTRVEAALARQNLCLAWMRQGGVAQAEPHCRFAAAAQIGDVRVRRSGNFYTVVRRNGDAAGTEPLAAVIQQNLAAHLGILDTARVASSTEAPRSENN
jgi:hypothetical protein